MGGGLLFFLLLLGGIVYFTRDEDNFQADNILAENFTLAVNQAALEGGTVNLREVASFPWDRVLLVQPETPRDAISERLGFEWTGIDTVDGGDLLIFLRDDRGRALRRLPRHRPLRRVRAAVRRAAGHARRGRRSGNPTRMSALSQARPLAQALQAGGGRAARGRPGAAADAAAAARRADRGPRLGPPLCVLFEGWDASGKGGAIKRLVDHLDPRHVRVVQYAAPTPDEKRHQYLLRFGAALPGWGGMAVLDRSWYGRVLVERVEGFAKQAEWKRAYREINDFERALCDDGMILVKLWLHVSEEEQLKRFEARAEGPAEVLEADRRGLAQPRPARASTRPRSRRWSRRRRPSGRRGRWSRRTRSATPASPCSNTVIDAIEAKLGA